MWYFVVFQPSKCKKTHFQPQIWSIWPIFPNDSESLPKVCYIKQKKIEILRKLRNSESAGGSGPDGTMKYPAYLSMCWYCNSFIQEKTLHQTNTEKLFRQKACVKMMRHHRWHIVEAPVVRPHQHCSGLQMLLLASTIFPITNVQYCRDSFLGSIWN